MSDASLPPPPPPPSTLDAGGRPPTPAPLQPPTGRGAPASPPDAPGASGDATYVVAPANETDSSGRRWKPVVAVIGSALAGAAVAFLLSWAVLGGGDRSDQLPISSSSSSGQSTVPSGPERDRSPAAGASGSQGGTSSETPSGAAPSARSGAS